MNVVSKDLNMISTMDECGIEDQYTTKYATNDVIFEDHETEFMSTIMGIKFKQPDVQIRQVYQIVYQVIK